MIPYAATLDRPEISHGDYDAPSWDAWRVIHCALDGLPPPVERLGDKWRSIWDEIAGGRRWPTSAPREPWIIATRRGAKTRELSRRLAWRQCTFDSSMLAGGERAVGAFIAADRQQSRIAFEYAADFIERTPMLARMIESRTAESLTLTNRTSLRVMTASHRTIRGITCLGACCDEVGLWWSDETAANPASEIYAALRPATATIPDAQICSASTPRARRGELWRVFRRYFGQDDPRVLVLRATWRVLNPTLDPAIISAATEDDPQAAASEYEGEFRSDLEGFVTREALDAVIARDRRELPPCDGVVYHAFADPSGGSQDAFAIAIAHQDRQTGRVLLDAIRYRRPPFSPDDVVREYAELLRSYRCLSVTSDRYAGTWPAERWHAHGIHFLPSERTKSELFEAMLPLVNSGRVELLDHPRLESEMLALERKTSRNGRASVDHPPRGHDDVANAAAGACVLATRATLATITMKPMGW